MIPALRTAASGMQAQQTNIDVISNNLANVNTLGFRKSRAEFADLLYQNVRAAGSQSSSSTRVPAGIQLGLGVRLSSVQKLYNQGSLKMTSNQFDMAIEGKGFFRVLMPDGTDGYTRAGNFTTNESGVLVTPDGYELQPQITLPEDVQSVSIEPNGSVNIVQNGETATAGTIQLATFVNPAGLKAMGSNLFRETLASGTAVLGTPGENQYGNIRSGYQEASNVNVVEEMVDMILAQRAYEVNSRSIKTADTMLSTATQLVR